MLARIRYIVLGIIDFFYKPFSKLIGQQTFRYLACGGSNTVLNILLYFISLHYILHDQSIAIGSLIIHPYIAAFIMAFAISFPLGFALSKYIVFPESNLHGRVQVFRYALLVGMCILLNYVFLKIFVELCHFYPTPSNVLTNALVAVFSYISQRNFTFKVKEEALPD